MAGGGGVNIYTANNFFRGVQNVIASLENGRATIIILYNVYNIYRYIIYMGILCLLDMHFFCHNSYNIIRGFRKTCFVRFSNVYIDISRSER